MNKKQTYINFTALFIAVTFIITPLAAYSASEPVAYSDLPRAEKIAYLYGMIAQIQAILDYRIKSGTSHYEVIVIEGRNSTSNNIDVATLSASNIRYDEAELRVRVDLGTERTATVWFEYGRDERVRDSRTNRRTVSSSNGKIQTLTTNIDNLRAGQRYYFRAVAEDRNGDRAYSQIRSFTTENTVSRNIGGYRLDINNNSVRVGGEIEIDWQIPTRETGSSNWIGLYKRGDSNTSYRMWSYLRNDDSGSVSFRIRERGDYEARLFLNNSYDDKLTSGRITVN